MAEKIRWGIIGTGMNAARFCSDLSYSKYGILQAIGSRSDEKARSFAAQYKAPQAFGSYEQLVRCPDVDIVYIATPHPFHMENTLLAVKASKAALCEKPFAMNAAQVRRMMNAAKKKKLFLMEAMWTRCFPTIAQVRKWLEDELIGEVLQAEADFGMRFEVDPEHRLRNPQLGGGALLDLGIYPVSFASMVFGSQPQKIASAVHLEKTGIDDQSAPIFEYPGGGAAVLTSSSRVTMRSEARIFGSKGKIFIPEPFYRPDRAVLEIEGKNPQTFKSPNPGFGFQFEADHVAECMQNGKLQSPLIPLDESLAIMQTMDKIRRQWKLKYPVE